MARWRGGLPRLVHPSQPAVWYGLAQGPGAGIQGVPAGNGGRGFACWRTSSPKGESCRRAHPRQAHGRLGIGVHRRGEWVSAVVASRAAGSKPASVRTFAATPRPTGQDRSAGHRSRYGRIRCARSAPLRWRWPCGSRASMRFARLPERRLCSAGFRRTGGPPPARVRPPRPVRQRSRPARRRARRHHDGPRRLRRRSDPLRHGPATVPVELPLQRQSVYPLIDWGRERCEAFLYERFGVMGISEIGSVSDLVNAKVKRLPQWECSGHGGCLLIGPGRVLSRDYRCTGGVCGGARGRDAGPAVQHTLVESVSGLRCRVPPGPQPLRSSAGRLSHRRQAGVGSADRAPVLLR